MVLGIGQSAGLLFKIDADASGAQRELRAVDAAVGRLGGQFSSFAGIATVGAASIAAIGAAAVTASVAIFNLTKATAEYGSEIFDATQKTGLGAEAISSLKIAADQSGSSLEAVTKGITIFAKNYKGTSQDLEAELGKLFKKINDAKPGFEQLTLATKSFGKAGADLIPVIKSFDGDLPGLIRKLRELGVTMTDEDARASDEFGDTLDILSTQAASLGRQFAYELMPLMTRAMQSISDAMADNKGKAREWGETLAYTATGVYENFQDLSKALGLFFHFFGGWFAVSANEADSWADRMVASTGRAVAALATVGISEILIRGYERGKASPMDQALANVETASKNAARAAANLSAARNLAAGRSGLSSSGTGGDGGQSKRDADAARRRAEQLAARDLSANLRGEGLNLGLHHEDVSASLGQMIEKMREFGTSDIAVAKIAEEFKRLENNLDIILDALEALENQQRANMTQAEKDVLTQTQRIRRDEELARIEKARADFKDGRVEVDKKNAERYQEILDEELKKNKELFDIEQERQELNTPLSIMTQEDWNLPTAPLEKQITVIDQLIDRWHKLEEAMESVVGTQNIVATMGNLGIDMFENMTNAVGKAIESWALYGGSIKEALKKALAAELAHIAAVATINAIYATALGFLRLAQWDFAGAANAFISAAIWASIAGGAALGARALAGDSFKKQAEGGSSSGGGSSQGQGNQPGLNFTTPFAGFQQQQNLMAGALTDAIDRFNNKFGLASPGQVVMAGAGEAAPAIFGAYQDVLRDDPKAATTQRRNQGDYRS